MKKVDTNFIKSLDKGSKLFYYDSIKKTDDYILYSVIDASPKNISLVNAFDEKEKKKTVSREDLLSDGRWFFNPSFE